jgi:2-methylcitrate dehydratase PrpD
MIASTLAEWVIGDLDAPATVRAAAARHLLDGFGTALGAARSGAARPAVTVATGLGGPPEATVIGTATRLSAPAAALANGTLVHALDFDDTHAGGLVHATSVVLPAVFAVGQQVGADGRTALDAAIAGLEVACRVAAAAPYRFQARGLHATMIAGVFSAAAVASRLGGLDAATTASALGIAGSQAGGLLAFLGTGASTKQLHPGFASQSGITAARLAAAGASGPLTVFDGPHGVYDALAGGQADPGSILRDLGTTWETERIGIKPYPACQLSHATVDAVGEARSRRPFDAHDVVAVEAAVHPDSAIVVCKGDELANPRSAYAAKFSLPWTVAAFVHDGALTPTTFDPTSIARPEVSDLARRVTWHLTDAAGAAADAAGSVRITLKNGDVVEGAVSRSAGGPDNPLDRDQLLEKFFANAGPDAERLPDLLERLDELDSVEPVLAATHTTALGGPSA